METYEEEKKTLDRVSKCIILEWDFRYRAGSQTRARSSLDHGVDKLNWKGNEVKRLRSLEAKVIEATLESLG